MAINQEEILDLCRTSPDGHRRYNREAEPDSHSTQQSG